MTNEIADLLHKACTAEESARLLLSAGDVDGACSRAYYAMFDAARAALLTRGFVREQIKSHSGAIGAFGLHVVKPGLVPPEIGRAINDVQEMRLVADYLPEEVPRDKAEWAVRQAPVFIDCVRRIPAVVAALSRPDGEGSQGAD